MKNKNDTIFGIYMPKDRSGTLTFGGYDLEKYGKNGTNTTIDWFPMPPGEQSYWNVSASGYGFENDSSSWNSSYNFSAILDTGTSFTIVPTDTLK